MRWETAAVLPPAICCQVLSSFLAAPLHPSLCPLGPLERRGCQQPQEGASGKQSPPSSISAACWALPQDAAMSS